MIYNNLFVVLASIGLFLWMSRRTYKDRTNRFFLTLGKGIFATYLMNDTLLRWIPAELLAKGGGLLWLAGLLLYAVLILSICLLIDTLKQKFFGSLLKKLSVWLGKGIDTLADKTIFRT